MSVHYSNKNHKVQIFCCRCVQFKFWICARSHQIYCLYSMYWIEINSYSKSCGIYKLLCQINNWNECNDNFLQNFLLVLDLSSARDWYTYTVSPYVMTCYHIRQDEQLAIIINYNQTTTCITIQWSVWLWIVVDNKMSTVN